MPIQALALHLLASLIGPPGGTGSEAQQRQSSTLVNALYGSNVPQALLQLLTSLPQQVSTCGVHGTRRVGTTTLLGR